MALPPFTRFSRLQISDPDYEGDSETNLNNIPALILPKITTEQLDLLSGDLEDDSGLLTYSTDANQVVMSIEDAQMEFGEAGAGVHEKTLNALPENHRAKQKWSSEDAPTPLEIFNLSYLQFINGFGMVFVDDLMPFEFLYNDLGSAGYQVCTLFTGDLPSSSTTPSALVELQSTTGALLVSRMTSAQMKALIAPANGMIVYTTDTQQFNFYQNSAWMPLSYINGAFVLPNMTTPQRQAISSPSNGMMVYDSTLNQTYTYQNTGNSFAQWGQMVTTINGTFPLPRLTTLQRQAVSSPNPGWMVFDSTLNQPYIYQNGAWQPYITANNLPLPALANGIQSYYTPGPYTWTPLAGISSCRVTIVGGGGGGGGSAGGSSTPDYYAAPGGGGGATVIKFLTSLSPSTPLSIIVGSGGAGGSGGGVGGTGGTTSVTCNSIQYSAVGGYGGSGTSSPGVYMGGSGGIASGGDINQNGQPGQSGGQFGNTGVNGSSGMGGSSSQGGGATGQINNTRQNPSPGTAGTVGGGGSGGYSGSNGSSSSGGAGGNGVVIIEY